MCTFMLSLTWLKNRADDFLLTGAETIGELNLEGEDEVTSRVVHHKRRQRIVIVDGHSLAVEHFLQLR